MKLADIRPGMRLRAVGSYADCIVEGDTYTVDATLGIKCRECESHELASTATLNTPGFPDGELPELEEIKDE